MARRCPGERRRRQAARADFVPRQGEGRRAGAVRLNAATGETVWKTRADLQPVGRGDRRGRLVIVPGSSIGYYYKELKGAKGDVTALDLKTGEEKWRKEIPTGGVLGCVAVERRPGRLHRDRRQGAGVQAGRRRARLALRREDAALRPAGRGRRAWCTSPTSPAPSTRST